MRRNDLASGVMTLTEAWRRSRLNISAHYVASSLCQFTRGKTKPRWITLSHMRAHHGHTASHKHMLGHIKSCWIPSSHTRSHQVTLHHAITRWATPSHTESRYQVTLHHAITRWATPSHTGSCKGTSGHIRSLCSTI